MAKMAISLKTGELCLGKIEADVYSTDTVIVPGTTLTMEGSLTLTNSTLVVNTGSSLIINEDLLFVGEATLNIGTKIEIGGCTRLALNLCLALHNATFRRLNFDCGLPCGARIYRCHDRSSQRSSLCRRAHDFH